MFEKRKLRQYQAAVQLAIATNAVAMFRALLHTDRTALDVLLAEFLLEEAGWTIDGFMTMVVNGDFDD
jgi:hypothetical protein